MHSLFVWIGILLCLACLWGLLRHDWLRLTRPTRRVTGRVTGHRTSWNDASKDYAAIFAFTDETGSHEVIDSVYGTKLKPQIGELRELTYPDGRPDLARPPRLLLWIAMYVFIVAMTGILFAEWMGWLQ